MLKNSQFSKILMAGCACAALSACGASDVSSPGTGGGVTINNPSPTPSPTPTPTPGATVTAAADCPAINDPKGLANSGTISGPTGSYRVCTLPSIISTNTTLPKAAGVVYRINGRVDVGCDGGFSAPTSGAPVTSSTVGCTTANGFVLNGSGQLTSDTNVTLTIDPGVIVMAGTGQSWLAVNRGNKINATGTASQPIIFTSNQNVSGSNDDNTIGQWGGVVLLGRAKITDCDVGSVGAGTCERKTEGAADPANFGGADDAYNAGTMKYVQLRYSGYVLGADKELQALTTGGVGSGTTLDYIQSHNSSDDGAEFFGGVVRFKHYIATGADDDSLDSDTGARASFQYVMLLQRPGAGDALMEIDSNGLETNTPRQELHVANFTAIQSQVSSNNESNDQASILLRGNSDTKLVNGIVVTPNNECLRIHGTGSLSDRATLAASSVVLQCNATKFLATGTSGIAYTTSDIATIFGANNNNASFTASLASLFINGTNETAVVATDPKTVDSFFDTTNWIGAVKDASDTWYAGWTCNSGYAPFDNASNANRACTSLPVT